MKVDMSRHKKSSPRVKPEYFSIGVEVLEETPIVKYYTPKPRGLYGLGDVVETPYGRGRVITRPTEFGDVYTIRLTETDELEIVEESDLKKVAEDGFEEKVKRLDEQVKQSDPYLEEGERTKQIVDKLRQEKAEQGIFIEPDEYSVKEVLKQTMQSALENKEGGRPHDLGYSGDAWVKVWIDETDLEFDPKIEEIKKMSISLDEKIELAKRRAYELALEQVNAAEGIAIEIKTLELVTDRIDWEEIFEPEEEKEGSKKQAQSGWVEGDNVYDVWYYYRDEENTLWKRFFDFVTEGEIQKDYGINPEEFNGLELRKQITIKVKGDDYVVIRRTAGKKQAQEDEDHVKLYNVAEEYTDDFGKVSYEKNPGLDEEEILKYYEVAPEEYAGLKIGELKEISPTRDTVYEIKRVANKRQAQEEGLPLYDIISTSPDGVSREDSMLDFRDIKSQFYIEVDDLPYDIGDSKEITNIHGDMLVIKRASKQAKEELQGVKMADIYRPDVTKTEWYSKGEEDKIESPQVLLNYPQRALFDTDIEYQHALEAYWKGYKAKEPLVVSMSMVGVKTGWLRDEWFRNVNKILAALEEVSDTFKEERRTDSGPGMSLFNYYTTSRYEEIEKPLRDDAITKTQARKLLEDLVYQLKTELFSIYGVTDISKSKTDVEIKEKPVETEKEVEKESVSMDDAIMYGEQYPPKGTGAGMPSSSELSRLDGEIPTREPKAL